MAENVEQRNNSPVEILINRGRDNQVGVSGQHRSNYQSVEAHRQDGRHNQGNFFSFLNRNNSSVAAELEMEEQTRIMADIQRANNIKQLKKRNKVRIQTKYSKRDILCRNDYPTGWDEQACQDRKVFKYNCPICLRYFNHILVSNCCNNYICRHCIGL